MQSKGIVYIVDDDAAIRRSTATFLQKEGYRPHPFVNGCDFIEALDYLEDGCVLLDMHMPGLSGLAVQEHLVEQDHDMPLVAMTDGGDISVAVQTVKRGAIDVLQKPFKARQLLKMLREAFAHLDRRHAAQARRREAQLKIQGLTPRERDVLEGLAKGLPNKLIAFDIGLSVRTVEMHRGNIMRKFGIHSAVEALQVAMDAGFEKVGTMRRAGG